MTTRAPSSSEDIYAAPAPFPRILCGVEGSAASVEAVRQAISLAEPGAALHFIAVAYTLRRGLTMLPELSEERLREALDHAVEMAQEAGVPATGELCTGHHAADVLLAEGRDHELLVIGSHGGSRAAGIVFGSTASQIAHERDGAAVLIARPSPGMTDGPESILLASDGTLGSWGPTYVAATLAGAFGSRVSVLHVMNGRDPERERRLEAQVNDIRERVGSRPRLVDIRGHATHEIVAAAEDEETSLIVIGRRRERRGIRALGSVSERVVHDAPCSVLLVPPAQGP